MIFVSDIKALVASHHGLTVDELMRRTQLRSVARPRQIAISLASRLTRHNDTKLGQLFDRDHTTVRHAKATIAQLQEQDPDVAAAVHAVIERLEAF